MYFWQLRDRIFFSLIIIFCRFLYRVLERSITNNPFPRWLGSTRRRCVGSSSGPGLCILSPGQEEDVPVLFLRRVKSSLCRDVKLLYHTVALIQGVVCIAALQEFASSRKVASSPKSKSVLLKRWLKLNGNQFKIQVLYKFKQIRGHLFQLKHDLGVWPWLHSHETGSEL